MTDRVPGFEPWETSTTLQRLDEAESEYMAQGDGDSEERLFLLVSTLLASPTVTETLTRHQPASWGMTGDSPDTCRCGAKVYPVAVGHDGPRTADDEISVRRYRSFAAHQVERLDAAVLRGDLS